MSRNDTNFVAQSDETTTENVTDYISSYVAGMRADPDAVAAWMAGELSQEEASARYQAALSTESEGE